MSGSANILAWIVLLGWPIVAFRLVKKYEVQKAVILALVIPYLFMPVKTKLDLPLIPPIDKSMMPSIALLMALYFAKHRFLQLPKPLVARVMLLLLFVSPFLTYFVNRRPEVFPAITLPGLSFTDIVQMLFENFLSVYVPFMLGYRFLSHPEQHEMLVKTLLFFGLIYSVLVLWEVRMSPQLHRTFYGYFPHDWRQQIRYGGFRPVVFLGHGLFVAVFMALTVLSAFTVWKTAEPKKRAKALLAFLYLFGVLVLCKSIGSLVLAFLFTLLLWFLGPRLQLKLIHYLMIVVIIFPVFRSSEYFPDEGLINLAASFDTERAESLDFRFRNENLLLERAADRSLFGWGGWGRNFIYSERDGRSLIIVDGYWIIAYSKYGWLGYIALFCIYALPIMAQARRARKEKKLEISPYTMCLCAMLALNVIDSLVNASITIVTGLIAGAVWANAHTTEEVVQKSPKHAPAGSGRVSTA